MEAKSYFDKLLGSSPLQQAEQEAESARLRLKEAVATHDQIVESAPREAAKYFDRMLVFSPKPQPAPPVQTPLIGTSGKGGAVNLGLDPATGGTGIVKPPSPQAQADTWIDQMLAAPESPRQPVGPPLETTQFRNTIDTPPVPEPPEALAAQMEALTSRRGSRRAVLVTPGEPLPPVPQGYEVTQTNAGTFIHRPDLKSDDLIRAVDDGSYQTLLGIHEPKGPTTTAAVVARDEQGKELFTALTSPQNVVKQAREVKRQFPRAKVRMERPEQVVQGRLAGINPVDQRAAQYEVLKQGNVLLTLTPEQYGELVAPLRAAGWEVGADYIKPPAAEPGAFPLWERQLAGQNAPISAHGNAWYERSFAGRTARSLFEPIGGMIEEAGKTAIAAVTGNAREAAKGAAALTIDPQIEQFKRAHELYKSGGSESEVAAHALAGVIPFLGPIAASFGEKAGTGAGKISMGDKSGYEDLIAAVPDAVMLAMPLVHKAFKAVDKGVPVEEAMAGVADQLRPLLNKRLKEPVTVEGEAATGAQPKAVAMKEVSDARKGTQVQREAGQASEARSGVDAEVAPKDVTGEGEAGRLRDREQAGRQKGQVEKPVVGSMASEKAQRDQIVPWDEYQKLRAQGYSHKEIYPQDAVVSTAETRGVPDVEAARAAEARRLEATGELLGPEDLGVSAKTPLPETPPDLLKQGEQTNREIMEKRFLGVPFPEETARSRAIARSETGISPSEVIITPDTLRAAVVRNMGGDAALYGEFTDQGLRLYGGLPEDYPIRLLEKGGLVERTNTGWRLTDDVTGGTKVVAAKAKTRPDMAQATQELLDKTGKPKMEEPLSKAGETEAERGLTRNFRAGTNDATLTFASETQRDLYDLAANERYAMRGGQDKAQQRAVRDTEPMKVRLAKELGISPAEVSTRARAVHDDVKAQMKGVQHLETRAVVDNIMKPTAEPVATPKAETVAPPTATTEAQAPEVPKPTTTTAAKPEPKPAKFIPESRDEVNTLWNEFKENQRKKRGSGGLDSDDITRLVRIGAYYVREGARDLTDFTRRLVEQAGEEARAWAPILHERAVRLVDRGEMHDLTGTKNALVESERVLRGMASVEKQIYTSMGKAYTDGRALAEAQPSYPRTLAESVAERPRPLTKTEVGALAYDRMQLQNAYRTKNAEIARLIEGGKDPAEAYLDLAKIEREWNANDQALERGGREQSAAFNARKMVIRDDYDILPILQRVKAASGKAEVDVTLKKQLTDLASRYKAATEKIGTQEERISKLEAELAVKRMQREMAKTARAEKRAGTKASLDDEFASLKAQFVAARKESSRISSSGFAAIDPEGKLTELVGKMALNRVKAGVNSVEGIVDHIYTELQDQLQGLSKRDVRDAISGYGRDPQRRTVSEMSRELMRLKREMKKLSKTEDIAAGKIEEPRQATRRKQLTKDIAELQRRIEGGQYEKPSRTVPTYDASIVKMVRERDQLRFKIDRLIAKQKRSHPLDIVTSGRQSMMLGNLVGIAQDIVSTTGHNITATAQMLPAAINDAFQSLATKQRVSTIISPVEMGRAIAKGIKAVPGEAKQIAKEGLSAKQAAEQEVPHELNTGSKVADRIIAGISRARSIADLPNWEVGFEIAKAESSKAAALTEAKAGKIARSEVGRRAKEIHDNMTLADQLDIAMESAAQIAKMEATQEARVRTFKQDNLFSDMVRKALSDKGGHEQPLPRFLVRLVLPFDKAMTNYVKAGFDLSGAGVFTGLSHSLINMARANAKGRLKFADEVSLRRAQKQANLAFSRGVTGGAGGLLLGYTLARLGVIGDPKDAENKQKGRGASLHIGGHSFDLGWTGPIAVPLAIGAGYYYDQLQGAKMAGVQSIKQAPLIRGSRELYNWTQIGEGKNPEEKVATMGGRLVASFVPGVVKDVARLTDQTNREQKGFLGPIKAAIPGLKGTLPEREAKSDIHRKAVDALRKDPKDTKLLDEAVKAGKMTPQQKQEIITESKLTPLQVEFKGKSIEEALKAYRGYSQAERDQTRKLLVDKWANATGAPQRSRTTGEMGERRQPTVPPAVLQKLREQFAAEIPR